jgi:hypothetical protein
VYIVRNKGTGKIKEIKFWSDPILFVQLVRLTPVLLCYFFGRSGEPRSCLKSRLTDKRIITAPETAPRLSALILMPPNYSTYLLIDGDCISK